CSHSVSASASRAVRKDRSRKPARKPIGRSRTRATTSTMPSTTPRTKSTTPPTASTKRSSPPLHCSRRAPARAVLTESLRARKPRSPSALPLTPPRWGAERHLLEHGFDGVNLPAVDLERLERHE